MPPVGPDDTGLLEPGEALLAPWTPDEVYRLNRRQESRSARPYACPRHRRVALFATRQGWICGAVVSRGRPCRFRQGWALRSDLDTW